MAHQEHNRYGWDQDRVALRDASQHPSNNQPNVTPTTNNLSRLRSDESWVEISSQPSSSSLSSAATDDVITTGLRVQHSQLVRRRRRLQVRGSTHSRLRPGPPGSQSSQEEYDESESEEDGVMSSSNENVVADASAARPNSSSHVFTAPSQMDDGEDEDDDDGNATALGVPELGNVFTPQPNAFSHPPSARASQVARPQLEAASQPALTLGRPPMLPSRHPSHNPFNVISPSHRADHDAALRASLSTLLSCAAAARGLSKREHRSAGVGARPGLAPETLRIVPESVVLSADSASEPHKPAPSAQCVPSNISPRGRRSQEKAKRKMSSVAAKGDKERVAKKARSSLEESVAPTLLTWVVSAGVVVLVSAISFSAGYSMGKEVGRSEVNLIDMGEGRRCGKEAVRGLGRFRWSSPGPSTVSV